MLLERLIHALSYLLTDRMSFAIYDNNKSRVSRGKGQCKVSAADSIFPAHQFQQGATPSEWERKHGPTASAEVSMSLVLGA